MKLNERSLSHLFRMPPQMHVLDPTSQKMFGVLNRMCVKCYCRLVMATNRALTRDQFNQWHDGNRIEKVKACPGMCQGRSEGLRLEYRETDRQPEMHWLCLPLTQDLGLEGEPKQQSL